MGTVREHPHLEERYFQRMSASLGDKRRILEQLPQGDDLRVLDVGAGGGELSFELVKLGYKVTAIDASDDAVMRMRKKYPEVTTKKMLANQIAETPEQEFDAVICSSILHEVFSYGDDLHSKGDYGSIEAALEAFYKVLKPGGKLIIRDGVLPDNWEQEGTIRLMEGHEEFAVDIYLKMCPFANGLSQNTGEIVNLTKVGDRKYSGNVRSLLEFAYTYTWGLGSYVRETQELYAVHTLKEYVDILSNIGFTVEYAEEYLQPGYPENLYDKMILEVGDETDKWFNSNALWVATKPE